MTTILLTIDHDSWFFRYGAILWTAILFGSIIGGYHWILWVYRKQTKAELLSYALDPFSSNVLADFVRGSYTQNHLVWFLVEIGKRVDVITPLHIAAFEKLANYPPLKESQRTELLISAHCFKRDSYNELCELIYANHIDLNEIQNSPASQ